MFTTTSGARWVLFFICLSLQILQSFTCPQLSTPSCSVQPWVVFCSPWLLGFTPSACEAVPIIFTIITSDKAHLAAYSAMTNPNMTTVSSMRFLCPPVFLRVRKGTNCTASVLSIFQPFSCKGCPADTDHRRISWQVVVLQQCESLRGWKNAALSCYVPAFLMTCTAPTLICCCSYSGTKRLL